MQYKTLRLLTVMNCFTIVRHFDFAVGAEIRNTIDFVAFALSLNALAVKVAV